MKRLNKLKLKKQNKTTLGAKGRYLREKKKVQEGTQMCHQNSMKQQTRHTAEEH
jgi:hypothetical protein